ncbi:hypothetical protein ACFZBU_36165 [Embleya sp. NPDC008237]|uniref:hypothetical protein n=1 Tax=Embleya sp. NPDC008237 TaxID=3363978 RepID=UPI0036E9A802
MATTAVLTLSAACSSSSDKDPAGGPGKPSADPNVRTSAPTSPPTAARPVISEEDARRLLAEHDAENNAANAAFDSERLGRVEGGSLYEKSTGSYRVALATKRKPIEPFTYTVSQWLIPPDTGYPKQFAAIGTTKGSGPLSGILYFAQERADAPWKLVFSATLRQGEQEVSAEPGGTMVTYPRVERVRTDAGGLAVTLADDQARRAACGEYAGYVSVGPATKAATDPRFAEGSFTDKVVSNFNATITAQPALRMTVEQQNIANTLPVFELASGAALVPCAAHVNVDFHSTGDITLGTKDAVSLLGGKAGPYSAVQQKHISLSLLAVPLAPNAPITVLDSSARQPQILSVTATPSR